jgi:hypothetical protein
LFDFLDPGRVIFGAEGEAGIIAGFLSGSNFTVEAAEEVNEFGVTFEVCLRVLGAGEFLEEELREAGGGGLEADFGDFGGIVAAEEIEEMVLVEAVLEDGLLFEGAFEVAAGGPIGEIAFADGVVGLIEGGDDVFVRDPVPEHAVDHVPLEFGETGDAAMAADFAWPSGGGSWRKWRVQRAECRIRGRIGLGRCGWGGEQRRERWLGILERRFESIHSTFWFERSRGTWTKTVQVRIMLQYIYISIYNYVA